MDQEEDLLNLFLITATTEKSDVSDNKHLKNNTEVPCSQNESLIPKTNLSCENSKVLKDTDIFQFESNTKLFHKKPVSIVHSGDTDSSDDEGNRNYEDQKYNQYGREIKSLINSSESSALESNTISSSHYGVSKKRVSTWKRNSNNNASSSSSAISTTPAINTKPMFGKLPEGEKKFHDVFMDPIFGMRIINPLISSSLLMERMQGRLAVRYSDLAGHFFSGNLKDKDWVLCGVVVSKSPPKTSSKGKKYSIWTLSDLKDDIKTFSLFLFSTAHTDLWKTIVGTVVGVLNPNIMDQKDGQKEISLSVNNAQKVMVFGQSKDFGTCKSLKKNGEKCTAVVNLSKCEYCIYHIKQEYQKCSKRSELQANFAGQGLVNLRNKVLGKNEVFYAGKSYTAIPTKKSKKLELRDNSILQNLSGTSSSRKPKNVPKNRKGMIARHLDVNPAQRARDLKLLEKLGGSTSLESKTNFSGQRSDEITLEDSKLAALSVINKLKERKSNVEKPAKKTSQFNLKSDLFVNVENKKNFSGHISEEISLQESKNTAVSIISMLKNKSNSLKENKSEVTTSATNEDLVSIEEIVDQINFEDLNYSDNDSLPESISSEVLSNLTHKTDELPGPTDLSLKIKGSSIEQSKLSDSPKRLVVERSININKTPKQSKINIESFGSISPKLTKTGFNPNNHMDSKKASPKYPGKNSKNHTNSTIVSGLSPTNLKQKLANDSTEYTSNSPKKSVSLNSKNKLDKQKNNTAISSNDVSSTQPTNSQRSFLNRIVKDTNSISNPPSDLDKISMDIPMLSGFGKGYLIDLSKPITSRHVSRAKVNAIKYIQRNGPIKKIDPNRTNKGGKKRNIDKVLGLSNEGNDVVDEGNVAKKSKLQESEFISDRFKKMMAATSKYAGLLEQHDDEEKEKYFKKLEVKESMEEKMTNTQKVKCKAVRCLQCKYTSFSASELCKSERHPLKICSQFNEIGSKLLSRGFIQLEKRHAIIYRRVKSALPRRESERKSHPLARHSDILQAVETRMSMLNMTYMRYIENRLICFVPGKVLDEIKSILDLVESNKNPPRTHQLLQELRDLSSMAMEHFDEHILPKCKEQLDQRTGSPEKILKELEVVAGSLTPYPKFQDIIYKNAASTSKSTRLLFNQQLPQAISAELYKVKKVTKSHKRHISYLTQNTQKLYLKMRRQTNKLRIQTTKIHEQERRIQEQNSKILEQEAALTDIKKHIDEWDQKYKDLTAELVRARDEILLKATSNNSPIINSSLLSPPVFSSVDSQGPSFKTSIAPLKSNIKPRAAHILPKNYLNFDYDRKRKSSLSTEIPIKRNRSPSSATTTTTTSISDRKECSPKMGEDIQNLSLNVPDLENFDKYENSVKETDTALAKVVEATNRSMVAFFKSGSLANALNSVKARKRKMTEDIDLK